MGSLVVLGGADPDRPSARLLLQDDMEASIVDLADERWVGFDYLRRMRDVVSLSGASRVLHVGGAGCALARSLASSDPSSRQEVVEASGEVLEVARRWLGLRRMPGLRVRIGDGRAAVASRADGSWDAVLVDAFVGARVPRHLVTAEALADVARVASVCCVNVVDDRRLSDSRPIAAGLLAAFAFSCALAPSPVLRGKRGGNVVLVASSSPLPIDALRVRAARDISPASVLPDLSPLATTPFHD